MSAASHKTAPCKLRATRVTLDPFRGPIVIPKQHDIYLVDGAILTEPEGVALHEDGKFSGGNIVKLPYEPERLQRRSSRSLNS